MTRGAYWVWCWVGPLEFVCLVLKRESSLGRSEPSISERAHFPVPEGRAVREADASSDMKLFFISLQVTLGTLLDSPSNLKEARNMDAKEKVNAAKLLDTRDKVQNCATALLQSL